MRRGNGHRPVPELRPNDPRHGNGKSRDVDVDNISVQGMASSEGFNNRFEIPPSDTAEFERCKVQGTRYTVGVFMSFLHAQGALDF